MNDHEMLVANELSKHGLRCESFTKTEMAQRKTPDFKVFRGDEFVFFCEVKEIASRSMARWASFRPHIQSPC